MSLGFTIPPKYWINFQAILCGYNFILPSEVLKFALNQSSNFKAYTCIVESLLIIMHVPQWLWNESKIFQIFLTSKVSCDSLPHDFSLQCLLNIGWCFVLAFEGNLMDIFCVMNTHNYVQAVKWQQGVKLRLIQAPMQLIFHFGDQILKISHQIGD